MITQKAMSRAQQPNPVLKPFLRDKNIRCLCFAQAHAHESVIRVRAAAGFGSLKPVVSFVPFALIDTVEILMD